MPVGHPEQAQIARRPQVLSYVIDGASQLPPRADTRSRLQLQAMQCSCRKCGANERASERASDR
eukprot:13207061-Alexandrium_andersonii.AAC.1